MCAANATAARDPHRTSVLFLVCVTNFNTSLAPVPRHGSHKAALPTDHITQLFIDRTVNGRDFPSVAELCARSAARRWSAWQWPN